MEQKVWSSRECSMNSKEISRGCFSKWKHISADSEAGQKSSGYRIPILIIRDSQAKTDCLKVMSIFFKFSHVLSLVEQPPLKSRKWEVRIVFRKKKKFKQRNIHQPSHIYNGAGVHWLSGFLWNFWEESYNSLSLLIKFWGNCVWNGTIFLSLL